MKTKISQILNHLKEEFKVTQPLYNLELNFLTNRSRILEAFSGLILWDRVFHSSSLEPWQFYLIDTREIDLPITFDTPNDFILKKEIEQLEFYINRDDPDILFIRLYKNIRFYIDLKNNFIFGALVLGKIYSEDFLAQFIIFPILNLILRHRGFYSIHSGCIAKDGKGILFPAQKESGKSTVSLYLAKSGFDFLSDETVFGNVDSNYFKMFGFPRQIKLYNDAYSFFPELSQLKEFRDNQSQLPRFKVRFPITQIFNFNIVKSTSPKIIVFPRKSKSFSLIHIDKMESMKRVLPEAVEYIYKDIANNYLDFLERLVNETESFILDTGSDLDLVRNEIEGLLK